MTRRMTADPVVVRFWGTRGILPVATTARQVRSKIVNVLMAASGKSFANYDDANRFIDDELYFAAAACYGGATSCVEIDCGADAFFVCDMGSGLQALGRDATRQCQLGRPKKYNFFLSHLEWDHIMGFPSFLPASDSGSEIVIYACHGDAERALRQQQNETDFPAELGSWAARISFVTLEPGAEADVDGLHVTTIRQDHPNGSFGYRFQGRTGRSVVYSTDGEHNVDDMDKEGAFVAFFEDADLVICDTMYSLADASSTKEHWGHSSNVVAIDLCHRARAKRLALYHHDPFHDDDVIQRLHDDSIRYETLTRDGSPLEVLCAYDGLEVVL
jgi:phosphoribosyl 1,2-cyclic phosphodiesterase